MLLDFNDDSANKMFYSPSTITAGPAIVIRARDPNCTINF